jgi:hypothetical protein
MAAATAAVTSMPGVLSPELAASKLPTLIVGVVVLLVPDNNELTAETELMVSNPVNPG